MYWVIPVLIFDVYFYYFVQHLVERNSAGFSASLRFEPIIFLFLASVFSIYCVRIAFKVFKNYMVSNRKMKYGIIFLVSMLLFLIVIFCSQYVLELAMNNTKSIEYYLNNIFLIGFLHLIVGNAAAGILYFEESIELRNALEIKAKQEAETKLSLLKQQLSPHFLFNNLNTLSALITEDSVAAEEYTQRLSKLYRYATEYMNQEVVTLRQEIEFALDFFKLAEIRFGNIYKVELAVPENSRDNYFLVPMSMQTLLDNVMKHNAASIEQPLQINILLKDEELVVKNKLRPKLDKVSGIGVGLSNLKLQYETLTSRLINAVSVNDEFIVTIPLIKKLVYANSDY